MPVVIENLTNRPILLRLNSGKSLNIRPRRTSVEISSAEIKGNLSFRELIVNNAIVPRDIGPGVRVSTQGAATIERHPARKGRMKEA